VKGLIAVFQPSRFYPCLSGRDNIEDVRGLDVWKLCLALYLQNAWFKSVNQLATFGYVVGVFLPWKFNLVLRNLNWSANANKSPSLSEHSI
jgi:hypothetical protein